MIVPMVLCGLSYYLRSGWTAADIAGRSGGLSWWIGGCWLPTFVPSVMLLYSVRKRDRDTGIVAADETHNAALLHSDGEEGRSLRSGSDPFASFRQNLMI